jgi:hypothetical protein
MYPGYAKKRIELALKGQGKSSTIQVVWTDMSGGAVDDVTGAVQGGDETELSGTLPGFIHRVGAETKLRQFAEIQTGDMMLDVDPAAEVAVFDGQVLVSGTIGLDAVAQKGVRFLVDGQWFTQAEIGEDLAAAWNVIFADQRLIRTILLRKAV